MTLHSTWEHPPRRPRPSIATAWVWSVAIIALLLACGWAVSIPFHAPIQPPAYCGAC